MFVSFLYVTLKSLSLKNVFLRHPTAGCLSFTVQMMYVQNLTLKDCFHIHPLEEESFSELIENLLLRGGSMGMICDITTSLEQTSTLAQKEVEQEKHLKENIQEYIKT